MIAFGGGEFDLHFYRGMIRVGGPVPLKSLPGHCRVNRKHPMDIPEVFVRNKEIVQEVRGVETRVPPCSFVKLGGPSVGDH